MMNAVEILASLRHEIELLCRKYAVKRLQLFGSTAKGTWHDATSDFDFIVEFASPPPSMRSSDQYFEFKDGLSAILGREVDLLELTAVKNPYLEREIKRTALDWYAA